MTGRQFITRVRAIGKERGIAVRVDEKHGKGSQAMLYYGTRATTVKDRRKELGPGLLSAMIRQLGLIRNDFQ